MSSFTTKKRTIGIGLICTLLVALIGTGLFLGPVAGQEPKSSDDSLEAAEPKALTASIGRGDLVESKSEVGKVGHGEPWAAPIEADGVVTNRHDQGTVIEPGQNLIWIDNKPVLLAKGSTPMYRTLQLEGTKRSNRMSGDDVEQLQGFLIEQGFDDKERLETDGVFGLSTQRAVKAWQKEIGRTASGAVDRSQLVFHPSAVRIDAAPRIGSSFSELQITEGLQTVSTDFDNKSRPFLPIGGSVGLDLEGETVEGVITEVTSEVADNGDQILRATIEPSEPLPVGVERVEVTATRTMAADVLTVPVRAVLALAGGGYGLEVDIGSGVQLRAVELGVIVDDVVEISGEFAEGDEVVVPNDQFGEQ